MLFLNLGSVHTIFFANAVLQLLFIWRPAWGCCGLPHNWGTLRAVAAVVLSRAFALARHLKCCPSASVILLPSHNLCASWERGEVWDGRWGVRGFEVMRGQGSRQGFAVGVLRRPWSGVEQGCHMAVRCECTLFACGMYSFCACVRMLHDGAAI